MYGVFLKGDSGASSEKPIKIIEDLQLAKEYTNRRNDMLSPFEKVHMHMEYHFREVE